MPLKGGNATNVVKFPQTLDFPPRQRHQLTSNPTPFHRGVRVRVSFLSLPLLSLACTTSTGTSKVQQHCHCSLYVSTSLLQDGTSILTIILYNAPLLEEMLITLLNKLASRNKNNKNKNKNQKRKLPSTNAGNTQDIHNFEEIKDMSNNNSISDEWQMVVPISTDEDYHVILPSAPSSATASASSASTSTTSQTQTRPSNLTSAQEQHQQLLLQKWNTQRQQQRSQLDHSIHSTFTEIIQEQPNLLEEKAIQRAMELSLLDFALVSYKGRPQQQQQPSQHVPKSPHDILGIPSNATVAQIKAAYRELAKIHHPDKGGDASMFADIAKAYRSLLTDSMGTSSNSHHRSSDTFSSTTLAVKSTAHWDEELKSHRQLVQELFQADGMDLQKCVEQQLAALDLLSLTVKDAGAINRNEQNEPISNSCFYLSLAMSYLWGIGALSHQDTPEDDPSLLLLLQETALQLKRTIEAAVVKAHPEWCLRGQVGEEVQAFSDFLVYTLDSPTLLSDWAVVVYDTTSGFVDIYKGKHYDTLQCNTITLRYVPGHYQALVPVTDVARRPTLPDIVGALDAHGVFYVITDGNS
jgi:DnaJ-domain-containing protein 1